MVISTRPKTVKYSMRKKSSNPIRKCIRSLGKPNSFELWRGRKKSSFQFVARVFNLFSSAAHYFYSTSGTYSCKIKEKIEKTTTISWNHIKKVRSFIRQAKFVWAKREKENEAYFNLWHAILISFRLQFVYSTSGTLVLAKSRRKFILDS